MNNFNSREDTTPSLTLSRRSFFTNSALTLSGLLVLNTLGCKTDRLERKEWELMIEESPALSEKIEFFREKLNIDANLLFSDSQIAITTQLESLDDKSIVWVASYLQKNPSTAKALARAQIEYPNYTHTEQVIATLFGLWALLYPKGETRFTPYLPLTYWNSTVYIVNDNRIAEMWHTKLKGNWNIPAFITMNLDAIWLTYGQQSQVLTNTGLDSYVIDSFRFFVAILEQEEFHHTNPHGTERESEFRSIEIGGQFYMCFRIFDIALAANPEHAGKLLDRLENEASPWYKEMYDKFVAIFKKFAPHYIPTVPHAQEEFLTERSRIITENPGILTYMCKETLASK